MPCRHEPLTLLLLSEVLAGPRSKFQVYLQYLPQQYDILLLWTPDELQELQDPVLQAEVSRNAHPHRDNLGFWVSSAASWRSGILCSWQR